MATACLGVIGACQATPPPAPAAAVTPDTVELHVPAMGDECTVNTQMVRCAAASHYVQVVLRLPADRWITLRVEGTESSVGQGREISGQLQAAGYSHIVAAGFMTEPGQEP